MYVCVFVCVNYNIYYTINKLLYPLDCKFFEKLNSI